MLLCRLFGLRCFVDCWVVVIGLIVLSDLCAFVIVIYFIKLLELCFVFRAMLLRFVFDYLRWYFRFCV